MGMDMGRIPPMVASNVNPVGNKPAVKPNVRMENVPEKGVTRYFFQPPVQAGANKIHKAEIVIPKDGVYEIMNVYAQNGNIFSCIVSKNGNVFLKECTGNSKCEQIKDTIPQIVNLIKSKDSSKTDTVAELLSVLNEPANIKNEIGKPVTVRRVLYPALKDQPSKEARYTIISPDNSTNNARIIIGSNTARLEIEEKEKSSSHNSYSYICEAKLGENQSWVAGKPYVYVLTGDPDLFPYKLDINNERRDKMLSMLQSMLEAEHNPEYIHIINAVLSYLNPAGSSGAVKPLKIINRNEI